MFTAAAVRIAQKHGHAEAGRKEFCRGHRNNQSHKHIIIIRFKKLEKEKQSNDVYYIV